MPAETLQYHECIHINNKGGATSPPTKEDADGHKRVKD